MKTANIPVYIGVYITYCAVCLKIDYTLRCLDYICSVSSRLQESRCACAHRPLNREDTDNCTITYYSRIVYIKGSMMILTYYSSCIHSYIYYLSVNKLI